MERYTKKIICICLCALIVALNIKVARAEAVPDVMCGSATVADCVMSYYAMSGAAIANTDWINTLYNDLGSSFGTIYDFVQNGMLTLNGDGTWQATTALETAIENAPAYQSLGLDQVFNVTSAEVAAGGGLAAASGGSILGGALGCTASVGVLPLLGGVTAAYWGGIALGTIIAHAIGLYGDDIECGYPIFDPNGLFENVPAASKGLLTPTNVFPETLTVYENCNSCYLVYVSGNNYKYKVICQQKNDPVQRLVRKLSYTSDNLSISNINTYSNEFFQPVSGTYPLNIKWRSNYKIFDSESSLDTYYSNVNNKNVPFPKPVSPDLIGENGNLEAQNNNGNITVPDMKPQIDPGVQSGVPLTLQDWLNFANSVTNNNSNTNPLPDNSALFDNILNLVKKAIPNPNPNPNPNPDPYTPPVPTPTPNPDYDPNPDNPNQPDYESEREGQTEPVPDSVPTGAPWITDGLLDKFPFCIPKDMIDMVKNFSSGTRQAPYISWRFNPPNTPVDYTFNLDLSDFEEIATLLRLLELGAFIVGLAFATRYLIGAT